MNRVIRSFSIVLVFSLLLGVFCSFDIYQAADELIEYPEHFVQVKQYISYNDSNYSVFDGNYEKSTFYVQYQFVFSEPIDGNSVLNLSFALFEFDENSIDNVEFIRANFTDKSWNVVKQLSSNDFRFGFSNDNLFDVSTCDISLGASRTVQIYRLSVYFKVTMESSSGDLLCVFENMNYFEPGPSLGDITDSSPEDKENINNSNNSMIDNNDKMDSMLDDMATVPEPDADDLVANLDKYLPTEHIAAFSSVLGSLFQNDIVIAYVMIGLVVSLVSFVLFGKKG